jgi:lipoic acid synthetase
MESGCPNKGECFGRGAVTFLALGRACTRACTFCNVSKAAPEPVDLSEPARMRQFCEALGQSHAIITSVTRDDLADGGAAHIAECVKQVKSARGVRSVEVLVPDFGGDMDAVDEVLGAGPAVFSHNIETVERLYPLVRRGASYPRSVDILRRASARRDGVVTKSGLIVGMGESVGEVEAAIADLAGAGCDIVTVGQYLQPSREHLRVKRYLEPALFENLESYARNLGLVALCGPRVRSSYRAESAYCEAISRRQRCA